MSGERPLPSVEVGARCYHCEESAFDRLDVLGLSGAARTSS